jgi:hypothetical protein
MFLTHSYYCRFWKLDYEVLQFLLFQTEYQVQIVALLYLKISIRGAVYLTFLTDVHLQFIGLQLGKISQEIWR